MRSDKKFADYMPIGGNMAKICCIIIFNNKSYIQSDIVAS